MPANVWAAEYHIKIRKKIASANDNGCSRTAADHQCGGPGRTRTCNQTVMSGRILIGFVDFAAVLLDFELVRCVLMRLFLVRNWCGLQHLAPRLVPRGFQKAVKAVLRYAD
jgi:hypothetical protein